MVAADVSPAMLAHVRATASSTVELVSAGFAATGTPVLRPAQRTPEARCTSCRTSGGQAERVMANLVLALRAAGASSTDVVKTTGGKTLIAKAVAVAVLP